MRQVVLLLISIIGISASSFGNTSTTNIVIEIIEFDCSDHPDLFNDYSQKFKDIERYSQSCLFDELKRSDLPKEIILHHDQLLRNTSEVSQSTELNGSAFSLKTTQLKHPGVLGVSVYYSSQFGETEARDSAHAELIIAYGSSQIFSMNFETSSSNPEGDEIVEMKKIGIAQISLKIRANNRAIDAHD
ncbi:MAG: hypothetical protein ACYTCV_12030 [Planctomycetota bacterium]|jgi:hypothetical protein